MLYCRELKHRHYGMVYLCGQVALRSRTNVVDEAPRCCFDIPPAKVAIVVFAK